MYIDISKHLSVFTSPFAQELFVWYRHISLLSLCSWYCVRFRVSPIFQLLFIYIIQHDHTMSHLHMHLFACNSSSSQYIRLSLHSGPKLAPFLYALTLPNINRFSKLFYYQNQEKNCNNTITKDPFTPQVCRYSTLWNVKCLQSNNWKQDGVKS